MVGSRLETQTRKTKINATFHSTAVYIVEERLGLLELRSAEEEAKVNTALSCRWIAASRKLLSGEDVFGSTLHKDSRPSIKWRENSVHKQNVPTI
jgi:hypothetical protein